MMNEQSAEPQSKIDTVSDLFSTLRLIVLGNRERIKELKDGIRGLDNIIDDIHRRIDGFEEKLRKIEQEGTGDR